ncbi:polyketide cyclase/dehydrase/lipid transport protein [Lentzea atacamensis]|uniref:Polyketide cyclase/dehydrase/lipid transport protein n=1 Tax=Lentzea atacamensis TaxID=531938 RepID=A0ABX9E9P1_9PSEU|nr:SRPBCC family protein [Lentzea atacamensis]RAS66859.1 polyketide cyclase/dehydrase/lipid transport protein [Lentzea atacamensis]
MTPDASAHIDVAASPQRVLELVSDLRRLGGVAEEYSGGRWLGATGPSVGARFRGVNRRGWRVWPTVSTVTDCSASRFAFEVRSLGLPVSRWQYDIEPTASGCRVTESTWDRRPGWYKPITVLATGVTDRAVTNQRNIEATLERLKKAAEA